MFFLKRMCVLSRNVNKISLRILQILSRYKHLVKGGKMEENKTNRKINRERKQEKNVKRN